MPKLSIIEYKNIEKEYFTTSEVKKKEIINDINFKSSIKKKNNKIINLTKKNIGLTSVKNKKIRQLKEKIKKLEKDKQLSSKEQKEIKIELEEDIKDLENVAITVNKQLEVQTNNMDEYDKVNTFDTQIKDLKFEKEKLQKNFNNKTLKLDETSLEYDEMMKYFEDIKYKLENEINKNKKLEKDIKIKNINLNAMKVQECPKPIIQECPIESTNVKLYRIISVLTLILIFVVYFKFVKK